MEILDANPIVQVDFHYITLGFPLTFRISTLHANSARQAVPRFADRVLQIGIEVPHRVIRSNIAKSWI